METNNHKDKSTVAVGAGFSLAGRGVSALLGLFFRRYLLLLFGEAQTGLLLLGFSVVNMIAPLAQFGIPIGIQRFVVVAYGKKDWNKVRGAIFSGLQIVAITTISIIILLWIFTPEISDFYTRNPKNAQYASQLPAVLRVYSIYLLPSIVLAVLLSILRSIRKIIPTFLIDNIYTPLAWLIFVLIIGASANIENKVAVLITCFCFIISGGILMAFLYLKKYLPEIKKAASEYCRKKMLTFSMPLLFRSFLQMFMQIDKLMIGKMCSIALVPTYAFAAVIARQSGVVMTAFASLFSPMIADLHSRGDKVALNSLYKTVTRWCTAFALPVIAIAMLVPELLLHFLGIVNSPDACLTVRIIAAGQIMSVIVGNTGGMLVMTNYPWLTFANNAIAVVLNIILNFILIPKYGIVGAAIATCAAIVVRNIAALIEVKKILLMSPFSVSLLKVVGCVIFAGASVVIFRNYVVGIKWWLELFYSFLIFTAVYLPILWIFMDKEDKIFITKIIKKNEK